MSRSQLAMKVGSLLAGGDDVTDNDHLAETIDMTREGSAQPGSAGYDEPDSAGPGVTLRDSCFHVAIEELR